LQKGWGGFKNGRLPALAEPPMPGDGIAALGLWRFLAAKVRCHLN
jgi:hypothetical protein